MDSRSTRRIIEKSQEPASLRPPSRKLSVFQHLDQFYKNSADSNLFKTHSYQIFELFFFTILYNKLMFLILIDFINFYLCIFILFLLQSIYFPFLYIFNNIYYILYLYVFVYVFVGFPSFLFLFDLFDFFFYSISIQISGYFLFYSCLIYMIFFYSISIQISGFLLFYSCLLYLIFSFSISIQISGFRLFYSCLLYLIFFFSISIQISGFLLFYSFLIFLIFLIFFFSN